LAGGHRGGESRAGENVRRVRKAGRREKGGEIPPRGAGKIRANFTPMG